MAHTPQDPHGNPGQGHEPAHGKGGHAHHLLSNRLAYGIWIALLVLTVITVGVARIDLGKLNFLVAMFVATIKASLVALFFMGLKYETKENPIIFVTSILFVFIFFTLTAFDVFFRNAPEAKGPLIVDSGVSKFKKPWVQTPELVAHGKEIFTQQCLTCHGPQGHGDGPASGSLNPKPRNFTITDGWKNGRAPSQVFFTLSKGLNSMPSFASLSTDDRWSAAHYVTTLGPNVQTDTAADYAKIGVDPTKETMGNQPKAIPIDLAIDLTAEGR